METAEQVRTARIEAAHELAQFAKFEEVTATDDGWSVSTRVRDRLRWLIVVFGVATVRDLIEEEGL